MAIVLSLLLSAAVAVGCPDVVPESGGRGYYRHYIGILSSKAFFLHESCSADSPPIDVFAAASTDRRIAQLQRSAHRNSCAPVVHAIANGSVAACPRAYLPVGEYEYDAAGRGFIALQEKPGWVKIELDKGSGWIRRERGSKIYRYEDLVSQMSGLTREWDGFLFRKPGQRKLRGPQKTDRSVVVLDAVRVSGKLWFQVQLLEHRPCSVHETKVLATGWVPGYDAKGNPLIDYTTRGC